MAPARGASAAGETSTMVAGVRAPTVTHPAGVAARAAANDLRQANLGRKQG
jgi:hypothetical protein